MMSIKQYITIILIMFLTTFCKASSAQIIIANPNYNQNQMIVKIICYSSDSNAYSFDLNFNLENHDSTSAYFYSKTFTKYGIGYANFYDTLTFFHPTYMHNLSIENGESFKVNQSWKFSHYFINFNIRNLILPYFQSNTWPNGYYKDTSTNNWMFGGNRAILRIAIGEDLGLNQGYFVPTFMDSTFITADYVGVEVDFMRFSPYGNANQNAISVNHRTDSNILTPFELEEQYVYNIPANTSLHVKKLIDSETFGCIYFGPTPSIFDYGGTYYDNILLYPVYNKYICPSEGIEINGTYISNEGLYIDSLLTTLGTDSIVGINLMYKTIVYGDTLEAEICEGDFYIFHDTLNIYNPGVYTFITENSGGCDSIFYLNLQIQNNMISNSIYNNNGVLTYDDPQAGYSYQWYNALTNMPITGENNPTYNPSVNGTYVLEISDGICSRSTNTITTTFGLLQWEKNMSITPNPFSESFLLDFTTVLKEVNISLLDVQSKTVYQNTYHNTQTVKMNNTALAEGIYYLSIKTKNQQITRKIICIR